MKKRPQFGEYKPPTNSYISLADEDGKFSFDSEAAHKAFAKLDGIQHTSLAYNYSFQNLLPGISGRKQFTRRDYEFFRPSEAIPRRYEEIIQGCDAIYVHNALVRYVIDLMSDFACQGIRLSHPNKSEQKFYQDWWNKVNGTERSERFLNLLYRHNMVTVFGGNAKVNNKTALAYRAIDDENNVRKDSNHQLPEADLKIEKDKVLKGKIPIKYTFLPPTYVHPKNKIEALKQNPEYIYKPPLSIFDTKDAIPLSKDNVSVYFYKKDDWVIKPVPFLWALIQHVIMIDKLNLADSAALDGATSRVRIFKVGDFDRQFFPDDATISKLDNILSSNVGGGGIDLIWTPDIEIEESKVDVTKFLGRAKFEPHIEQLYIGLGLPPTLVGIGSGTTNNLISLKTFVQRLNYGRQQLLSFWRQEIKKVQKAMGFSKPAIVEFDFIDMGEEAALRKLLMDMADRNIISDERLLELLGHDPDMEKIRVNREERERRGGRRADKTSPWHDPQFDISLKKVALQRGYISPNQAGIEIDEEYADEQTPFELQIESVNKKAAGAAPSSTNNKNAGLPGRPPGAKDTEKRKTKEFNPKIKAAKEIWATAAYNAISDIIKPAFFQSINKSNLRQLTTEEINAFEYMKFAVLCNLDPFSDVTPKAVQEYITANNNQNNKIAKSIIKDIQKNVGYELTLDQKRQVQIFVYTNEVS